MFANCFPTSIKMDHLNYRAGEASIAEMDITFTCTMYESPQINTIGRQLIDKYQVLMDSFEFCPKFTMEEDSGVKTKYDMKTGMLSEV